MKIPFSEIIEQVPRSIRSRVLPRIRARVILAFNQGVGLLLLGLLFLTVTALSLRGFRTARSHQLDKVRGNIALTLGTQDEATDTSEYLGLIGAVLAPINKDENDPRWICTPAIDRPECLMIDEVHNLFRDLVRNTYRFDGDDVSFEDVVASLKSELDPQLHREKGDVLEWAKGAAQRVVATSEKIRDGIQASVAECDLPKEASPRIKYLGGPGCDDGGELRKTQLIIPSQDRYAMNNALEPGILTGGTSCGNGRIEGISGPREYPHRVHVAVSVSDLLEPVVDLIESESKFGSLRDNDSDDEFSLVQVYFISTDSVLRIWNRQRPVFPLSEFPPTRLWASKRYFTEFWSPENPKAYLSRAYIDYGGNGIVRTRCSAIERPVGNQDEVGKELLGIICTDYALPRENLLKELEAYSFFDLATIEIPSDEERRRGNALKVIPRGEGAIKDPASGNPAQRRLPAQWKSMSIEELKRQTREKISQLRDNAEVRRSVTVIGTPPNRFFLVPTGSTPSGGVEGIIVIPKSPQAGWSETLWGICCTLFGGFALATLFYGYLISRRTAELDRRRSLLRSLQVGVIVVDEDDWFIEGNDRAEEVLRQELPKTGGGAPEVNFADIIFPEIVPIAPDEGGAHSRPSASAVQTRPYSYVEQLRREGRPSSYFALLRSREGEEGGTDTWIRVSGTPMFVPRGFFEGKSLLVEGKIPTFGTVDEVRGEEATWLGECSQRIRTSGGSKGDER